MVSNMESIKLSISMVEQRKVKSIMKYDKELGRFISQKMTNCLERYTNKTTQMEKKSEVNTTIFMWLTMDFKKL